MSVRALLLALLLAAAPRLAAACSKRHETPFELFDRAARVAEVRVTTVPARRQAGFAELRVLRTLKGAPRRTLRGEETNSSCHVGYRPGRRALVFLGPRGETLGHYEGYRELAGDAPLLQGVRVYAAARTDAERSRTLVDAIVAGPPSVRDEAATHLATHPELLAWLGLPERERLLTAYAGDVRDQPLLVVFARLALDVPQPPPSRYNVNADLAALLRPHDDLDDLNAEALAERIERGTDERDPQRIRAFERCERLAVRSLYPLFSYSRGASNHFWPQLAAACRTATPVVR
jgi:hypothetical protein